MATCTSLTTRWQLMPALNIPSVNATLYDLTPADLSSPFDATCSPTLLDGVQAAFGPLVSNYTAVVTGLPNGPVLQAFNSSAPSVTLFAVSNDDIGYADLYRTYTVGELLLCCCGEVPIKCGLLLCLNELGCICLSVSALLSHQVFSSGVKFKLESWSACCPSHIVPMNCWLLGR